MFSVIFTNAHHVTMGLFLSQVPVLLKQLNELGWFLAWVLPSTYPTLCCNL